MLFSCPKADRINIIFRCVTQTARLVLTLLVALNIVTNTFASYIEPTEGDFDFAVEKQEMQWSPGERYNGLNGTLNYAHTDLYLHGNGKLPIEIIRQFGHRSTDGAFNPIGTFGYMGLSIPSVSYTQKSGEKIDVFCSNRGVSKSTDLLTSPMTFRHGETQKVFFGGSFGSSYYSSDGWSIECQSSTQSLGSTSYVLGDLKVKRPDGVEYIMRHLYSGLSVSSASFRVVEMSDPYGNTLKYNYSTTASVNSGVRYGIVKLDSIVASDGRVVTISYTNDSYRVGNEKYNAYRIASIESNSSENPIKLVYSYLDSNTLKITKNDTAQTTISFLAGKINSIKYPTGGTITYQYQDVLSSAGTNYRTLKTRSTSDGATYDFSYVDNGDNTIVRQIKTPSAWLDYTYVKPKQAESSTGNVTNHSVNSGRLINFKRYSVGANGVRGRTLLSVDYTFRNLSPSSVSVQAAQLVVPKTTTTSMNSDSWGKAKSVFTSENIEFDDWGNPEKVLEINPSNVRKTSTYEYQSNGFSRRILGKLKTASRDGDIQRYTYNQQGDVKTHSINGISTSYEWHQTGNDKGELHKQTTALNHTTHYTDYKRGQAQRITNPSSYSQNRKINDNGTVAEETRLKKFLPRSIAGLPVIGYQYDSLRRLKRVEPERSASADVNYQWFDNKTLEINDSNFSRFKKKERLDDFGRTRAKGTYDRDQYRWSSVKYDYDSEGRLLFVSYPQNIDPDSIIDRKTLAGTHYSYDALDRITRVTNDENAGNETVVNYTYGSGDGGELTIAEKDGRGITTTTTYRSYGTPHYRWPVKIVDADGQVSRIDRNAITGQVTSFTRGGQTTSYTYNSNRLLTTQYQDENGTTTFDYYSDGRLKSRSNQGRMVAFEYYSDGLIHKELYSDNDKENVTRVFQYDQYRNLEYAITSSPDGAQNNTLHYTYDNDNNVMSLALIVDDLRYEMRYDYDELSNLKEVTYPNGRAYSLSPNSLGSPTKIQQVGGEGKIIYNLIQYNDNNTMKLMQRQGHRVNNELNIGQRPYKFRLEQHGNESSSALGERQYQYDKAANIARIDDTIAKRYMSFGYDSRNRLVSENISNGDNWSYDYLPNDSIKWIQQGNTRSTYEYNSSNKRLTGVRTGGVHRQYGYDAEGNMTAHERLIGHSSKVTRTLSYNAANQLVAMNDGTTYGYDARGLRVKQNRRGAIYTLYDPSERLIFRYDNQAKVSSEYFYVNGKLVARRDEDKSGDGVDPPTPPTAGKPAAPSGVSAQRSGNDVVLSWNAVSGAEKYNVYRNGNYVTTTTATRHVDSALSEGNYTYQVVAIDDQKSGENQFSAKSADANITVDSVGEPAYAFLATLDAEDGKISEWSTYDDTPSGYKIENKTENGSRYIALTSSGTSNGFIMGGWNANSSNSFKVVDRPFATWRMRTSGNFNIYITVSTAQGNRYLQYTSSANTTPSGTGSYIKVGLGSIAKNGSWNTIERNLSEDLKKAQPGNTLTQVNGFLVRGTMDLDDLYFHDGRAGTPIDPPTPPTAGKPAAPSGVSAQRSGNDVVLSWNAVSGAEKYNVYRNGNYINTVTGVSVYTDRAVSNSSYSYHVVAVDESQPTSQRYSDASTTVSVSAISLASTVVSPQNFTARAYSGSAAELRWTQAKDPTLGTAVAYEIFIDGAKLLTTNNGNSYWLSTGLRPDVTYTFSIVAQYSTGEKSEKSETIRLKMQNGSVSY